MHAGGYGKRIACEPSDGTKGPRAFMPCGINWEKRPVWVVEGLPTAYSQYAFSKRIMYIDKDTLGVIFMEAYDQGGELWRVFFNMFDYSKKPYEGYPARPLQGAKYNYEDEWAFDPHGMTADLQTTHGSPWDAPSGYSKPADWVNEWYFNEPVHNQHSGSFLDQLSDPERSLTSTAVRSTHNVLLTLSSQALSFVLTTPLPPSFLFC